MTKGHYQNLVDEFYQKHKPLRLIETIAAENGTHQCQLCGNRHLKYLCRVRNEQGEEWLIGRNCHTSIENLREQEFMIAMNEIITCQCGQEQRRGDLPRAASSAGLCKKCWLEQVRKGGINELQG